MFLFWSNRLVRGFVTPWEDHSLFYMRRAAQEGEASGPDTVGKKKAVYVEYQLRVC